MWEGAHTHTLTHTHTHSRSLTQRTHTRNVRREGSVLKQHAKAKPERGFKPFSLSLKERMEQIVSKYNQDCLENEERTFRFFDRGDYFHVVGQDARDLAKEIYHSSDIMKYFQEENKSTPYLALSKRLFASVIRVLLSRDCVKIKTFVKTHQWQVERIASAGNVSQFASELDGLDESTDALLVDACFAFVASSRTENCIGVVICNPTLSTIGACELKTMKELSSLLVKESVKMCWYSSKSGQGESDLASSIPTKKSALYLNKRSEISVPAKLGKLLDKQCLWSESKVIEKAFECMFTVDEDEQFLKDKCRLVVINPSDSMFVSQSSCETLGIIPSTESKEETLFSLLSGKCLTGMGSRLVLRWVKRPSMDATTIRRRHDTVEYFCENQSTLETIRQEMKRMPDLERAALELGNAECTTRSASRKILSIMLGIYSAILKLRALESISKQEHYLPLFSIKNKYFIISHKINKKRGFFNDYFL